MGQSTFSNGLGIAHKGSGGKSIVFSDVCKTPIAPSIVAIPYPNIGQSSDIAKDIVSGTTKGECGS